MDFEKGLTNGCATKYIDDYHRKQIDLLGSMTKFEKKCKTRLTILELLKNDIDSYVENVWIKAHIDENTFTQKLLDRRTLKHSEIVNRYMAFISKLENKRKKIREQYVSRSCYLAKKKELLRLSNRLDLFSVCVDYETSGKIRLNKLSRNCLDFQRCQQLLPDLANMDGVDNEINKKMTVLNVYRIKNEILNDSFNLSASLHKESCVKGLFCYVAVDCLEHFIVHGIGSKLNNDESIFWTYFGEESRGDILRLAEEAVQKCKVPCPYYYFSRNLQNLKLQPSSHKSSYQLIAICKVLLPVRLITIRKKSKFLKYLLLLIQNITSLEMTNSYK